MIDQKKKEKWQRNRHPQEGWLSHSTSQNNTGKIMASEQTSNGKHADQMW